ncbi:MFS transporter [Teredinibacter haidensis]|uniref:MFS transporter n=1 Tax=Teredinibacter haidensis TaxID=2731755 RepID=UPI000948DB32|nr:MFS transporter [Teredinibacter haidensis]
MSKPANVTVSSRNRFALGLGFFTLFFTGQGIHILAVPYYQMTLGVNPLLLSVAMTLPMLLGSTLGPWVGHLSDNYYHKRYGRRRPFIFVAAWCSGLFYGLVWMVPEHWPGHYQLLYFALTTALFYVAASFFTVPLNGLAYEITDDYYQRTRIMGFTAYFLKMGSLLYQWVFPLAQLSLFASVVVGVRTVGWGLALLVFGIFGMMPALLIKEHVASDLERGHNGIIASLQLVLKNRAMVLLILLMFLQMGGAAFSATMDYYLLVYFVHAGDIVEGAVAKGILSTSYALVSIACVPLVTRLACENSKLTVLKSIYLINAIGGVAKWFIFTPGAGWIIVLDAVLCGAIWTAMVVLIPSMIADLSQQHSEKEQVNHAGMYASVHAWVLSVSSVLAFLCSGLSLSLMGFDAQLGGNQPAHSINTMRIILVGGTILFSLLPLALFYGVKKYQQQVLVLWSHR